MSKKEVEENSADDNEASGMQASLNDDDDPD